MFVIPDSEDDLDINSCLLNLLPAKFNIVVYRIPVNATLIPIPSKRTWGIANPFFDN